MVKLIWPIVVKGTGFSNSALNWADQNCPEGFRLLAGYLATFWVWYTINFSSGEYYLEKALSKGSEETEAYARNLCYLGYVKFILKDFENAFRLYNESLSLWQRFKNPFEEAISLGFISASYLNSKDFRKSLKYSERSLDLAREVGKPGLINNALFHLCFSMVHSSHFTEALPYVEELLTSSEKLNHVVGIVGAVHFHSDCKLGLKDFVEAEKRYGLASQTAIQLGVPINAYADLQGVAFALSGQHRWAKSLRLYAAGVKCFQSIGLDIYGVYPMWDGFTDTYIGEPEKRWVKKWQRNTSKKAWS
jgi:tetratricopeptide (TPR) repeat protein